MESAAASRDHDAAPRFGAVPISQSDGFSTPVTQKADDVRADILAEATEEFTRRGYPGGRVNQIASRTRTSKRMIYYYFGSKEGLYKAVLFEHFRRLRAAEATLDLEARPPLEALSNLICFTFDWHLANAAQVPLVMVENLQAGAFIADLIALESLNVGVIAAVERICSRGVNEGSIRPDVSAVDIYMSIAALSFFTISNRHTFKAAFGHDMAAPASVEQRRASVLRMILLHVAADPGRAARAGDQIA